MPYTAWTTNLCPNSSFELDLAGWQPISGSTLTRTSQDAVAGRYSMLVQTLGGVAGEGVFGPQGTVTDNVTGSVSLSLWGETGRLLVTAAANPDGIILGQQQVTLNGTWQRVTLNGLGISATQSVYVIIQTAGSAQALSFLVDAVQYEPESPAHDYIDGSFSGCSWLGAPFESASQQQGQYSISMTAASRVEGSIKVTTYGETFILAIPAGQVTAGGSIAVAVASPVAAFDDFAMWQPGDPDPAMTYVGWNTASLLSGKSSYSRPWGIFYPPLDYPASDGTLMWKRAAFMAMGLQFTNVAASAAQNLTSAQVEMMPLAGTTGLDITPGPSAYDTPRSLRLIVKPARLNYCTNPSFDVSLAGWTATGGAALTQDATVKYGVLGGYDGTIYAPGHSMKVAAASASSGVQLTVPDLIAGDVYTASVYVLPTLGMADIQMQVGSETGGVPGADKVTPLLTLFPGKWPVAGWVRAQVTFTAPASTVILQVTPVMTGSPSFPANFWLAACLIEAGEIAGTYFDGSIGDPDYMWEGTPGLSRSYWYPNFLAGQQVVSDILASHTPMSISAADASYLVPPTQ